MPNDDDKTAAALDAMGVARGMMSGDNETMNGSEGGSAWTMNAAGDWVPPAPKPVTSGSTDVNENYRLPSLPDPGGFQYTEKPYVTLGSTGEIKAGRLGGARNVDVLNGEAGYQTALKSYFIIRDRRIENLAKNLPDAEAKALRARVVAAKTALQADPGYVAASPADQAKALDGIYAKVESEITTAGGSMPKENPDSPVAESTDEDTATTAAGFTAGELAAIQASIGRYMTPYANQAQATGQAAQASFAALAQQASTPAQAAAFNAQASAARMGSDGVAAAYMRQAQALPLAYILNQNVALAQQQATLQNQILGYQARSQQPQADATGGSFEAMMGQLTGSTDTAGG